MSDQRPYSPETLARRWGCSAHHIRNMINRGELPAFRLGGKLMRIRAEVVEEFEQCGGLEGIGESGVRSREKERGADAIHSLRIERKLSALSTG